MFCFLSFGFWIHGQKDCRVPQSQDLNGIVFSAIDIDTIFRFFSILPQDFATRTFKMYANRSTQSRHCNLTEELFL